MKKLALPAFLTILALVWALGIPGDEGAPAKHQETDGPRATATFAGGCFWCMEQPFDVLDGVYETVSGYTDGEKVNPTYKEVSSGRTGHTEAVQVTYNPDKISYGELLEVFWNNIDPTAENRQFCDRGTQYRSGIYTHDEEQARLANASRQALIDSGRFARVVTPVKPATPFYDAEEYHQDFYVKSPVRYKSYRLGCGRDRTLKDLWGKEAGH